MIISDNEDTTAPIDGFVLTNMDNNKVDKSNANESMSTNDDAKKTEAKLKIDNVDQSSEPSYEAYSLNSPEYNADDDNSNDDDGAALVLGDEIDKNNCVKNVEDISESVSSYDEHDNGEITEKCKKLMKHSMH